MALAVQSTAAVAEAQAGGPPPDSGPITRSAEDLRQLAIAVHFGVGAKYDLGGFREPLSFPFGADLALDFPIASWLTLGPRFAWRGSDLKSIPDLETNTRVDMAWLDLGPVVRFRVPITFQEEHIFLDVYLAVAPALTIARSPVTVMDGTALGFSIDAVLGFRAIIGRRIGFLVEGGWARHRANFDDASAELRSGTLRVGPVLAF